MNLKLLQALYELKLAEICDAEERLLRFLPRMTKAIAEPELRTFYEKHTEETKIQLQRLKQLIARHGIDQRKKSRVMAGLIAEAKEVLKQDGGDPEILNLALLNAGKDVEGHEVASYACAHNLARLLSFYEDLRILEESFHEEKKMEEALFELTQNLSIRDIQTETTVAQSA